MAAAVRPLGYRPGGELMSRVHCEYPPRFFCGFLFLLLVFISASWIFLCVCVCVCAGARRRFYAHLESGYARTWRRLDTAGRRAIRQRFDSYFQDRSPPRIPSYTYSWYSYYRAVIARRECSEPLGGAFGRLGSELKRKRILIVIGFSCFFLRRGNKSFCVCVCRTPAGAFSMDWALFPLLGSARFSAFAVSDWDFLYFVFFRGCRPFQWRSTQP